MKDKEKQIEEMAKDIENTILGLGIHLCNKSAEKLYNLGYRKIDKDSVVLSKEEYEALKKQIEYWEHETKVARQDLFEESKETAEKILNEQYQECKVAEQDVLKIRGGKNDDYYKGFSLGMTNTKMHIQELAKQFGVEIKE